MDHLKHTKTVVESVISSEIEDKDFIKFVRNLLLWILLSIIKPLISWVCSSWVNKPSPHGRLVFVVWKYDGNYENSNV